MFFGQGLSVITGDLRKAYQAKLEATNDSEKVAAEVTIKELESQMKIAQNSLEIRKATSGFWEMRLITFLIAASFTLHLLAVTADTILQLGWKVPAYPAPFDEWQGAILLSFFGIYTVGRSVQTLALAYGRKN